MEIDSIIARQAIGVILAGIQVRPLEEAARIARAATACARPVALAKASRLRSTSSRASTKQVGCRTRQVCSDGWLTPDASGASAPQP